ncbi:hypothetical protein ACP6C7_03735 [Mycolicibacterium septicum]|uniref:Uncharacterized protein n=1 Tax=Mycolicibacterium septicum TaxID=98668 RepID=A0ABW9LPU4_9MYCO
MTGDLSDPGGQKTPAAQRDDAHPVTGSPFGPNCGGGMKHGGIPGAYGGMHG